MKKHKYLIQRVVDAERKLIARRDEEDAARERRDESEAELSREKAVLREYFDTALGSARERAGVDPERVRYVP